MLFLWSSQSKEAYFDFIMYTSTFWEHNVLRDIQWDKNRIHLFRRAKNLYTYKLVFMRDATNMFAWDRAHVEVVNWELCLGVKGQVGTFGGGRFLPQQRSRTETSAKRGRRPQLRKLGLLQSRAICKILQSRASCKMKKVGQMKMEKIHRVIFWW